MHSISDSVETASIAVRVLFSFLFFLFLESIGERSMAVQSVQSTNAGIRRRQLFWGVTVFLGFDGPTVTTLTENLT